MFYCVWKGGACAFAKVHLGWKGINLKLFWVLLNGFDIFISKPFKSMQKIWCCSSPKVFWTSFSNTAQTHYQTHSNIKRLLFNESSENYDWLVWCAISILIYWIRSRVCICWIYEMNFLFIFQGIWTKFMGRYDERWTGSWQISTHALAWCPLCSLGTTLPRCS